MLHYSEGCFHEATRHFPLPANALASLNGGATGDNVLDPEITWSGAAAGSASFDPQAAAVGRDQTGSFRLFGLFSLSSWPDRERVYLVCSVCLVRLVG